MVIKILQKKKGQAIYKFSTAFQLEKRSNTALPFDGIGLKLWGFTGNRPRMQRGVLFKQKFRGSWPIHRGILNTVCTEHEVKNPPTLPQLGSERAPRPTARHDTRK